MPRLKAFFPGEMYASISITGARCWLNCKYCMGRYLEFMEHATTPGELRSLARRLWRRGVRGVLISGGYTRDGKLPIKPFLPAIEYIKRELGMVVSVHPGLVSKEEARELRRAGVDVVDFELILDPVVIREVKGLNKAPEDFLRSLEALYEEGPPFVAPHVPLGLRYGELGRELEAIDVAADYDLHVLVLLTLIPTPGTPMEGVPPLSVGEVLRAFRYARRAVKGEVALGCMRPQVHKDELDPALVGEGLVDRLAIPRRRLVKEHGMEVYGCCCSLPVELLEPFKL